MGSLITSSRSMGISYMQLNELTNRFYNLLTLGNILTLMFVFQKKKKKKNKNNPFSYAVTCIDKVCPYKQR